MPENIISIMDEKRVFYPSPEFSRNAAIKSMEDYEHLYKWSISDPISFWQEQAQQLHWFKRWDSVFRYTEWPFVKWFEGGKLNVSYNCLDRHLMTWRRNKAAIIWESECGHSRIYTYQHLHDKVCRFANVLKKYGIQRGDRVAIYMPMIPELVISMLACARIGAIHSVVFGGFSAKALQKRINDCSAKMLITADGSYRKGKVVTLKQNADEAIGECPTMSRVIVVRRTHGETMMKPGRDLYWDDEIYAPDIKPLCDPEWMDGEESLFILYTSGTTGTPKGTLHTTAGYLLYAYLTTKYVFDIKDEDSFWCTADIGWITGHTYGCYGPLSMGATMVMFEGVPNYPNPDRFWEIVEKYAVTIFYTAPTVIRSLMAEGDEWTTKRDLSSLRLLGSVGEPINPQAWIWYYTKIGHERCPIVDTWWQTETGGAMITPMPGATPLHPGSATRPFFGIVPAVYGEDGKELGPNEGGNLVIKQPWPAIARTVWGNPERYKEVYFSRYSDAYLTGDGAKKDADGNFWIMGRIDDVLKVSGHRIGTMEVESALVSHKAVAEAAVVPMPHEIKGEAIYAFVTLEKGVQKSENLKQALAAHVVQEVGSIAKPDFIQFADALPKTRSGKIMRRILKAIAEGKSKEDLGDTTTLADPSVVDTLIGQRG
jgi:acetyl-CoA synthetase